MTGNRLIFILMLAMIYPHFCHAQQALTIESIYGDDSPFVGKSLDDVKWVPQHAQFSFIENEGVKSLWLYDIPSNKRQLLFTANDIPEFKTLKRERRIIPDNYFWSPDGKNILINSGIDLFLFSCQDRALVRLTHDDIPKRDPVFSPDGKKIAYRKNHNLYLFDLAAKQERQLTREGNEHLLIGCFDYVYEEEFHIRSGYFWSPDSRHIAIYRVDETAIPEFPFVDYIPRHNTTTIIRYAKPGDPNAQIDIGVVDVENTQIQWMDLGPEIDNYIPRIQWLNDGKRLAIQRLNRQQNRLEVLFANIYTGKSTVILVEDAKQGWLNVDDDLTFLKNAEQFIWSSERTGYKHLYLYTLEGKLIRPLTSGEWDVEKLIAINEKDNAVYFSGTKESIFERHFYQIKLDGSGFKKISQQKGTHEINMNADGSYYLDTFSDFRTPPKTMLGASTGQLLAEVEPNRIDALNDYQLTVPEIFSFTTNDGIRLNAALTKPAAFDPAQKYPVIFTVYGGPESQTVKNSWGKSGYLWRQLLTQKGYLVFELDNRGTGWRGRMFKQLVYRRLGHFEVEDMVNGVEYLRTLPYVDAERIGIWGWSYGGYTTIMSMLKAAAHFKVGVAVASVTDWRNYDSIYTERYMDTPERNAAGYDDASALKYAHLLTGKLLLVHGAADDNVHLAHTMQLAHEFQKLNKHFDLMIYPQKDHSIRDSRVHLFHLMTDYFLRHL